MYPGNFEYHRADSVEGALDLLADHPDAEILAGGHSLLPTMKSGLASPDHLIDIGKIDALRGIERDGDSISIGALTTYGAVTESEAVAEGASVLSEAARAVGDVQVRNRGTIGGNLAHADPASDLPGAALAADATLVAQGPDGEREIPVDDFFYGMYATDLGPGELLTRVEVPSAAGAVGAYAKKASPSSGYAMVGVAALLDVDGGTVESANVAANGVLDHGVRLDGVADALTGETLDEDSIGKAASRAADDIDTAVVMDDLQASGEFRTQLLEVYTERALTMAMEEASAPAAAD